MSPQPFTSQKMFLSESLNQYITFSMIPRLSDEDLNVVLSDVSDTKTSLKEYLSLAKETEMDVYEEGKFIKARRLMIIADQFHSLLRREREMRFQRNQNLTKEDISELVENRKHLYAYEATRETMSILYEMLKETYGESVVANLYRQASERATLNLITQNNETQP
jgi:hypothetical protein